MPAATSKKDLIATHEDEYDKLMKVIETITLEQIDLKLPGENSSSRSVVNHRKEWMMMFIDWYMRGAAGKEVYVPAKGYKWNQLIEYNNLLWEKSKQKSWETIVREFKKTYKRFITLIDSMEEKELYGTGIYSWTGKWTVGRYSESAGSSHFRSARRYIKKILNYYKK